MKIQCPNCRTAYEVDAALIPAKGRNVQCSNCGENWFQLGAPVAVERSEKVETSTTSEKADMSKDLAATDDELGSFFRKSKPAPAQESQKKTETGTDAEIQVEKTAKAPEHIETQISNDDEPIETMASPSVVETSVAFDERTGETVERDLKRVPFEEVEARVNKAVQQLSERQEVMVSERNSTKVKSEKVEDTQKEESTNSSDEGTTNKNNEKSGVKKAAPKGQPVKPRNVVKAEPVAKTASSQEKEAVGKDAAPKEDSKGAEPVNKADDKAALAERQKKIDLMAKRRKIRAERRAAMLKEKQNAEAEAKAKAEKEAASKPEVAVITEAASDVVAEAVVETDETQNEIETPVDETADDTQIDAQDELNTQAQTDEPKPTVDGADSNKNKDVTDISKDNETDSIAEATSDDKDNHVETVVEEVSKEATIDQNKIDDVSETEVAGDDRALDDKTEADSKEPEESINKEAITSEESQGDEFSQAASQNPEIEPENTHETTEAADEIKNSAKETALTPSQDDIESQKQIDDAKFAAEAATDAKLTAPLPKPPASEATQEEKYPPRFIDELPKRPLDESDTPETIAANTQKKKIEQNQKALDKEKPVATKKPKKKDRPFFSGFIFMLFVLFLMFLVYFFRGVISDAVPALRPYLETYGDIVDVGKDQVTQTVDDIRSGNETAEGEAATEGASN